MDRVCPRSLQGLGGDLEECHEALFTHFKSANRGTLW